MLWNAGQGLAAAAALLSMPWQMPDWHLELGPGSRDQASGLHHWQALALHSDHYKIHCQVDALVAIWPGWQWLLLRQCGVGNLNRA